MVLLIQTRIKAFNNPQNLFRVNDLQFFFAKNLTNWTFSLPMRCYFSLPFHTKLPSREWLLSLLIPHIPHVKLFIILGSRVITALFLHDFARVFNIRYWLLPSLSSFFLAIIVNRLILCLIKSHNTLLSITSLNSSRQSGTLWLDWR